MSNGKRRNREQTHIVLSFEEKEQVWILSEVPPTPVITARLQTVSNHNLCFAAILLKPYLRSLKPGLLVLASHIFPIAAENLKINAHQRKSCLF